MDESIELLEAVPSPYLAHLTSQQRMLVHLCKGVANNMDKGPAGERRTANLLRTVAAIVTDELDAEASALWRAWLVERTVK